MDRLIDSVDRLAQMVEDYSRELACVRDEQLTQFRRFAQLQAEVDALKHSKHELTRA